MRLALLAALAAVAITASADARTAPRAAPPASGLYGLVTQGPISPVCRVGVPCTKPAAHAVLIFARRGANLRTHTDARGHYRVHLPAGRYFVYKPDWGPGSVKPSTVTVPRGRFARANFMIDTGIR